MRRLIIISLLSTSIHAAASGTDSISARIWDHESMLPSIVNESFLNPAQKQWQWNTSLSRVEGGYERQRSSRPMDVQTGLSQDYWKFHAESYMKHRTSTLWGESAYCNGKVRGKQWCEALDTELIYPYFPADERGGDVKMEQYAFSGGYADHTSRWGWGAQLGYTAGLYYRQIDPRPRTVTGRLELNAGASYRAWNNYRLGLGVVFMKYKQSVDIEFVSEMGEDKIFHTTGMGTHYVRFAGNGSHTCYNGVSYGVTLGILPSTLRGFTATATLRRFTFDVILFDLNKLPMSGAWHNSLSAQAGYLSRGNSTSWGVTALFNIYKRHGHENIFGDATGSVYPQIGSLDTYADNCYRTGITGVWEHALSNTCTLHTNAEVTYTHRCEAYFSPARQSITNRTTAGATAALSLRLPKAWTAMTLLSADYGVPMNNSLILRDPQTDEAAGLVDLEHIRYHYNTLRTHGYGIELQLSHAITRRYALMISAKHQRKNFCKESHITNSSVTLSFIF